MSLAFSASGNSSEEEPIKSFGFIYDFNDKENKK